MAIFLAVFARWQANFLKIDFAKNILEPLQKKMENVLWKSIQEEKLSLQYQKDILLKYKTFSRPQK